MADSPEKGSSDVLKCVLYSNGTQLADSVRLVSLSVVKALNKIPYAKLVIEDGNIADNSFPVSDGDDFKPGASIKVNAGYGGSDETIFEGVVVRHGLKIDGSNYSRLVVDCRDKAVAMTVGRRNANYVDSKDSDIISQLIGNHSGLSSDVTATSSQHEELVQYYCSDWDFMLVRAEANGAVVNVEAATVTVGAPKTDGDAVLSIEYGDDLMEFSADVDAKDQLSKVTCVGWDPGQQAVVTASAEPKSLNEQGDLSSSVLAETVDLSEYILQSVAIADSDTLTDWAKAQQVKSAVARIQGRMKFQGSSHAMPNTLIEVSGVGSRFNGNVYVSSVRHEIGGGDWITEVEFGHSLEWFAEAERVTAPVASGLAGGVEGLQIGVVMKLDGDPAGHHRIQVSMPLMQAETEGVWARLCSFYASDGFGSFVPPEVGDEVVVGYLNGDPSTPVIIASLYSSKRTPAYELAAENNIKAFVTRTQLTMEYDEEMKSITLKTPASNTVVMSDDAKSISLEDQTGNKLVLDEGGITLSSPKDITISADGKFTLKAVGETSISSDADVSVSGLNINNNADVGFVAKGSASAELSASGETSVKGAMVMIN